MTPGARVQAAIDCLERIEAGTAAEKALTGWARGARYAGSKDRAAVRDHVYDVLRQKRSCAALGGGKNARALMLGLLRGQGADVATLFNGVGHAPAPLDPDEAQEHAPYIGPEVPDWMLPLFEARYGAAMHDALAPMSQRADVFLRVNLRKTDMGGAVADLAQDDIVAQPVGLASGALIVLEGARKIARSRPYLDGLVELQDASSQAAMETLEFAPGARVLDYCAGGGGKVLALAGRGNGAFFAHDANPGRMRDLPVRAERAGVNVALLEGAEIDRQEKYDVVLCDVPCSGSGTWRRDPDAKWRFTSERLSELNAIQDDILDRAAPLVSEKGQLVYSTCSLLAEENDHRIAAFLSRNPSWALGFQQQWDLTGGADGFFVAHLSRA